MRNSERLNGLELLRLAGAPVPYWHIVESTADISRLEFPPTPHGWTVRTCRRDGVREIGLFYANYASPHQVRKLLQERLDQLAAIEYYIVYPSWKFAFSCNVVFLEECYYVEGKYSSQKGLAMGVHIPDFSIAVPFGMRSQMSVLVGTVRDDVNAQLGRIIYYCRRTMLPHLYAEVAMTTTGALIFYELFELKRRSWFSTNRRSTSL